MSNFVPENHFDTEDYHQMQAEHYRSKHSRTDAQRREAAIREARRHPQGARLIYPPETYTPNGGQLRDSPPPVPPKDKRPASGRKLTNVRTGPDGLRMETPQTHPRRVINRSQSGRFRPEQSFNAPPPPYDHRRNVSAASTVASAAPSRPFGHQRMGSGASAVPSAAPGRPSYESSRVSLESQRPQRPGSAGSSIFSRTFSLGRTNTNESSTERESTGSRKPTAPRRSSFKETLRRASNEIQKDVSIMRMTPAERQRHFAAEKARMDAEIEEHRRLNPLGRPKYQQEYIRQRDISRAGGGFQQYEDVLMHYGTDNPIAHLNANELTLAQDFALTYKNDDSRWGALADRQKAPPMNTGERAAFLLSKGLDAFKKEKKAQRNMSTDSGMDFADCGEPDELDCCERCGKPTTEWLVKGFCRDCHQARVNEFWDTDSTPTPIDEKSEYDGSVRSSRSSSPNAPREVNEEDYMKIARKRTIRRVRQTIYEDPGNPFAVQTAVEEDEVERPSQGQMETGSRYVSSPRNPSLSSWESLALSSPSHQVLEEEHEQQPHVIRHLRDSLLHAPRPRRAGTPQLIRQHKYSESVPDPMPEEVYVPPRTLWATRGKSLPTNAMREERDTRFYGFWEGVLREYGSDMVVEEEEQEEVDGML